MKKYIKYISLVFVGVSLVTSFAYAEDTTTVTTTPEKPDSVIKNLKEENKNLINTTREDLKKEIDLKREEIKNRINLTKETFKKNLLKIKDEKKKETVQRITDKVSELNTKAVDNLTESISKIDEILTKIETGTNEKLAQGVDTKATIDAIAKAKISITDAKNAIIAQSSKIYTANITTDVALKSNMSKIKDSFSADIKNLRDKVQAARVAIKTAATSLELISKSETPITTTTEVTNTKVEEGTTTNN